MTRNKTLIHLLSALVLLFAAAVGRAEEPFPDGDPSITAILIEPKGAADTTATRRGRVIFKNRGDGSTRIVFAQKDAGAFACEADGDGAVRSRSSQYLLRDGGELPCVVRPGRYRYTTLSSQRGEVNKARSTLRIPD